MHSAATFRLSYTQTVRNRIADGNTRGLCRARHVVALGAHTQMVNSRLYRDDDAPVLLALFKDTIRRVNIRDYTPDQVRAWASDDIKLAEWTNRFIGNFTLVAEIEGQPVGFAELEKDGHIGRVYVSADHQRCGIGRMLLEGIVTHARLMGMPRLFTEASITARPFFEAQGFTMLNEQVVSCRGVEFINYRMERVLS